MDPLRIAYVFDPLCGWCYGASPVLAALAARDEMTLELVPTGLFGGGNARTMDAQFAAYAWSNDQRIGRMTGQPFSEAYRRAVLGATGGLFDSAPATLALTAVALGDGAPGDGVLGGGAPGDAGREMAALRAIQHARYVEGRDITDGRVLAEILRGLGLDAAAARLDMPDADLLAHDGQRLGLGQEMMRRFGIAGVPALVVGLGEDRRALPAGVLFGGLDGLLANLRSV